MINLGFKEKNNLSRIKKLENVIFFCKSLLFVATYRKNYIRFFINFYCGVSHLEKF